MSGWSPIAACGAAILTRLSVISTTWSSDGPFVLRTFALGASRPGVQRWQMDAGIRARLPAPAREGLGRAHRAGPAKRMGAVHHRPPPRRPRRGDFDDDRW